jgi:hypothetical protein
MHQFIENYFKESIDSIKILHNKINQNNESNKDIPFTIYFDHEQFYAIKNNDLSTSTHLSLFNLNDLLKMDIAQSVDKNLLEEFILSIF